MKSKNTRFQLFGCSGQLGELQRDECRVFLSGENVLRICLRGQLQVDKH